MTDAADRDTVTLGAEEYQVLPQPYPRLFRKLSAYGDELQQLGEMSAADPAAVLAAIGGRVHEFLRIFIPNLMAEHRFAGYPTQAAMEADEFDEQAEGEAPTLPQIIDAIETVIAVNGGARLGSLVGKLLGPALGPQVQKLAAATISERLAQGSTNSPSPPDGPTPGGSTTPSPTPDGASTPPAPALREPASAV